MSSEISIFKLHEMFPDEESAESWFQKLLWPKGPFCPACQSKNIHERPNRKPQPFRCRDCRKDFSVRTGTLLHGTHLPLQKWVFAIYLMSRPKGIASAQLARDLGITQKTAWFLAHRIREACVEFKRKFSGAVEVDETYVGGSKSNKHYAVRKEMPGRGTMYKTPVIGIKERESKKIKAKVLPVPTYGGDLRQPVYDWVKRGSLVYSDDELAYRSLEEYIHFSVTHSKGEYVVGSIHTNGLENFWSQLKRGFIGVYHSMSPKHLWRYVREFTTRHNLRSLGIFGMMKNIIRNLRRRRLTYQELIQ